MKIWSIDVDRPCHMNVDCERLQQKYRELIVKLKKLGHTIIKSVKI